MTQAPTVPVEQSGEMTHRQVLEALSGLLLAMFVAMLSSTVVSNALPAIVTDLHGSQTGYTWVVVATMLTMTATTPIWGKLADLFARSPGGLAEEGSFAPGPGRPLVDDEEIDRWGELWRWENELRRSVDQWYGDADTDDRPGGRRRQDPDAAD